MALLDRISKSGSPNSQNSIAGPGREFATIPGAQIDALPKPKAFGETGVSGLLRTRGVGYVYEEWLSALSTYRAKQIYREMRDNDAVIGAMFFGLEMILRKAEWRIEPAKGKKGDDYAEFLKQCMEDMSHTWEDFIAEAISMFTFGFALFEIVYKRRKGPDGRQASKYDDGMIGWRKFAPRAQESILYWIWDEEGGLQGAVQLAAPDYKTIPMPIDRLLLFRTTSLKNSPEGRSILRNCYRCFTPDHDVLTNRGWVPIAKVKTTDRVATLNPDTDEVGFCPPKETFSYYHEGPMIHVHSKQVDQLVTENHEMWVRSQNREWRFEEAKDLTPSHLVRRELGKLVGRIDPEFFELPEIRWKDRDRIAQPTRSVPIEAWADFLGFWLAEGSISPRSCVVYQKTPEQIVWFREVLERCGFGWNEQVMPDGVTCFGVNHGSQLYEVLGDYTKPKQVPPYVRTWSPELITRFLDAHMRGDGWIQDEVTKINDTAVESFADQLHELAVLSGSRASLRVNKQGTCYFISRGEPCVNEDTGVYNGSHIHVNRVDYEGKVHCINVPPHHLLYVRRNGQGCWSGNSWFFKRRIEEVEGIGIERDLCGIPVLYASAETLASMGGGNPDVGMTRAKQLVTNLRIDDQAGVILPLSYDENKNPMVKLELLHSAGGKQTNASEVIKRYNEDILNTMLSGFIQFGQTQHGSKSMHLSASQIFTLAISAFMDSLAAVVNRIALPRLMTLNNMDVEYTPKLQAGEVGVRDLEELGDYITKLSQSGLTFFDKPTSDYLRKTGGLPATPEEPEVGAPPPEMSDPYARNELASGAAGDVRPEQGAMGVAPSGAPGQQQPPQQGAPAPSHDLSTPAQPGSQVGTPPPTKQQVQQKPGA